MEIKVLIVDDSQFFCRRVGSMLNAAADIKIVGVANNGREAIEKAEKLQPDVITLDVEMPIMDGVTALKQIVKVCDARVLMLSSLTYENAKITLDALEAGATDFLLKSYEAMTSENSTMVVQLQKRIRELGRAKNVTVSTNSSSPFKQNSTASQLGHNSASVKSQSSARNGSESGRSTAFKTSFKQPRSQGTSGPSQSAKKQALSEIKVKQSTKLVVIGASTGGPVALQKILAPLPASFPYPITVTQHMPGTFTGAFANRLDGLCKLKVVEAEDGMPLRKGWVYIAPGGKQMVFEGRANNATVKIRPTDSRLPFAPSVDLTFGSASKIFKSDMLAIILTGMGNDGTEGSRLVKRQGGQVWSQNEASCVVYGMPMSVTKAGLSDAQISIEYFSAHLTGTA
jgi:two-component system, chemotaxis family, protein-glutamate methylesterase/glutaminase